MCEVRPPGRPQLAKKLKSRRRIDDANFLQSFRLYVPDILVLIAGSLTFLFLQATAHFSLGREIRVRGGTLEYEASGGLLFLSFPEHVAYHLYTLCKTELTPEC